MLGWLDTVTGYLEVSTSPFHLHTGDRSPKDLSLTGIGDKVGIEACGREQGSNSIDIALLVTVRVTLSIRWAGVDAPGVIVGNIGGQSTNSGRGRCVLVNIGEEGSGRSEIGRPAQPAGMT